MRNKKDTYNIYSYYNRGENQTEWHAKVNNKYIGWFNTYDEAIKECKKQLNIS